MTSEMVNAETRLLAVTLGDPSGVGPEVAMAGVRRALERADTRFVVIGDRFIAERAARLIGWDVDLVDFADGRSGAAVSIYDTSALDPNLFVPSQIDENSGAAALASLEAAVELMRAGTVAGIVTAPVSKAAILLSQPGFLDQATFFATRFGIDPEEPVTMVAAGAYRCFLVTKHVPLSRVAEHLTIDRIQRVVRLADASLRRLGVDRPRIAVASLNPHVGENGMLGTEEIEIIRPALVGLADELTVPPTLTTGKAAFASVTKGNHDGVVAMYHDQSAPVELLGGPASTVTLGLPVVRTSVGHGTAFDIAWTGSASPDAMSAAIALTRKLVAT